jgi:hypothetical protein
LGFDTDIKREEFMKPFCRSLANIIVLLVVLIINLTSPGPIYGSIQNSGERINNQRGVVNTFSDANVVLPLFQLPYGYDPDDYRTYEGVHWSGGPHEYGNLATQGLFPQGLGSGLDFSPDQGNSYSFCNTRL